MQEFINMLIENHKAFNQPVRETPGLIPNGRVQLRIALISEEHLELREAGTLADYLKELCDLVYVIAGTCVEYGFVDWDSFDELIKLYNDHYLDLHLSLNAHSTLEGALAYINENESIDRIEVGLTELVAAAYDLIVDSGFSEIFIELFKAVHKSNMTKLVDGKPIISESGKYLKGPNYQAPDLLSILKGENKLNKNYIDY